MFASVPMLAYGMNTYNWEIVKITVLTTLTLYSGYFAALIWNDINDSDIDKIIHKDRALPKETINKSNFFLIALFFSFLTFSFSFLINIWCFLLVGTMALFVAVHNKYLKRTVKLPAFSEIFTPLQWVFVPIFGFTAIWGFSVSEIIITQGIFNFPQALFSNFDFHTLLFLVLFTYFVDAAHDIAEGIHDIKADQFFDVKTYATSFGIQNAAKVSFSMLIISGIFGILLYWASFLSIIFIIPFLIIWFVTIYRSSSLVLSNQKNMGLIGKKVGKRIFDFLLMSYNLIFLDVFIQLLLK